MTIHTVDWTPARVEYLTKRWKEGASASQIAFEIGAGATRNSVIGKVTRLKLPKHSVATRSYVQRQRQQARVQRAAHPTKPRLTAGQAAKAKRVAGRAQQPACPLPPPIPPEFYQETEVGVDFTSRVGMMDLTSTTCRFPASTPWEPPYMFCGNPVAPEQVYCEHHCRRAYRPAGQAQ